MQIAAADIGTGTWTALTQIAADALACPVEAIQLEIGDSALPLAGVAGGSTGISSWGSAIVTAARAFRERHGTDPSDGAEAETQMAPNPDAQRCLAYAWTASATARATTHLRREQASDDAIANDGGRVWPYTHQLHPFAR